MIHFAVDFLAPLRCHGRNKGSLVGKEEGLCCCYFKDRKAFSQCVAAFFEVYLGRAEAEQPILATVSVPDELQAVS